MSVLRNPQWGSFIRRWNHRRWEWLGPSRLGTPCWGPRAVGSVGELYCCSGPSWHYWCKWISDYSDSQKTDIVNSFSRWTIIKLLFLPGQRTLFGIQKVLEQLLDFIWSGRLDIGLLQRWWPALFKIPLMLSCLRIKYEMKVLLAPSLARDPTLITSIRYLATGISYHREQSSISQCSDKKNGFRNFVMSVMVEMGVHKKGDPLDPDGLKAKLVFGITQLIYTLITIIPVSIQFDTLTSSDWISWSLFQFRPCSSSPPTPSPAAGWSWSTVGAPGTELAIILR